MTLNLPYSLHIWFYYHELSHRMGFNCFPTYLKDPNVCTVPLSTLKPGTIVPFSAIWS